VSGGAGRVYRSTLRADQARQTRRNIVAAASELFVTVGYVATTIDAVAEKAGVGRRTVFSSVGGKPALLKLAWDWALAGDDEPVPMVDRPAVQRMMAEDDPRRLVTLWCANAAELSSRAGPLGRALRAAAGIDAEAAEQLEVVERESLSGARAFVGQVDRLGGLHADLTVDQAAELVWAYMGPGLYEPLVLKRGWGPAAYQACLDRAVAAAILAEPFVAG
jgi:AcrR family transcriptional regulator